MRFPTVWFFDDLIFGHDYYGYAVARRDNLQLLGEIPFISVGGIGRESYMISFNQYYMFSYACSAKDCRGWLRLPTYLYIIKKTDIMAALDPRIPMEDKERLFIKPERDRGLSYLAMDDAGNVVINWCGIDSRYEDEDNKRTTLTQKQFLEMINRDLKTT